MVIYKNGTESAAMTGYMKLFSEKYSGRFANKDRTIKVQPMIAGYFLNRPGTRNARKPMQEISTRYSIITDIFSSYQKKDSQRAMIIGSD
jgi:hypothetical protein